MLLTAPLGDDLPTVSAKKRIYSHLYVQVLAAITIGVLLGYYYPAVAVEMKPLGDAFIKLIRMIIAPIIFCTVVHGIASMSNSEGRRQRRHQSASLFRGHHDAGSRHRTGDHERSSAGGGHERRPKPDRRLRDRKPRHQSAHARHRRVSARHHSENRRRRFRGRQHSADPTVRAAVRLRATGDGTTRPAATRDRRSDFARAFWHRRHHHEGGTDRRLWRNGVHHRQLRLLDARLARNLDGGLLSDVRRFHLLRSGADCLVRGFQHFQVHPLYQGRAAHRARHVVLRICATADDRANGATGMRGVLSSGSSSRRVMHSISTAPAST